MYKIAIFPIVALLTSLYTTDSLASYASAQNTLSQEVKESSGDVERIEVVGRKPLRFFKNQLWQAEKAYIKQFNALVDSEFQIHCVKDAIRGTSRIKRRRCAPRYETNLKRKNAFTALDLFDVERTPQYVKDVAKKAEESREVTAKLLEKNPQLRETFLKMNAAREALDKRKKQKNAKN
jgi:hypothetical protein